METNQTQWRFTHPAHIVMACLQDASVKFFIIFLFHDPALCSDHCSPQLDNSLLKMSFPLPMASCCETVWAGLFAVSCIFSKNGLEFVTLTDTHRKHEQTHCNANFC